MRKISFFQVKILDRYQIDIVTKKYEGIWGAEVLYQIHNKCAGGHNVNLVLLAHVL